MLWRSSAVGLELAVCFFYLASFKSKTPFAGALELIIFCPVLGLSAEVVYKCQLSSLCHLYERTDRHLNLPGLLTSAVNNGQPPAFTGRGLWCRDWFGLCLRVCFGPRNFNWAKSDTVTAFP